MERLTEWKDNRNMLAKTKFSGDFGSANILCKLAEYEDLEELIGVPLKEIAEIFRQNIPEDCKHPRKAIVLTDDDVDKWNGYKNAEEQGLLLRLPCKVGDDIYVIPSEVNYRLNKSFCVKGLNAVCRQVVDHIEFNSYGYLVSTNEGMTVHRQEAFGETWFLTMEEAEQKLKEMESGNNGTME